MQRRAFLSAALCLAMAGAVAPAQAQSGVTTIIVGLAPGGSMDSSARLLAERLQRSLGGTFVVENRLGAGSRLAVGYTKRATPDGRTIMIAPHGPMTLAPHIYQNMGFDPLADFESIGLVSTFDYALVAGPEIPVTNGAELVAWAKANPGGVSFGSPGTGSTPHFIGEVIGRRLGIEMTNIPYKGSALTVNDVAAGILPFGMMPTADAVPMAKSGRIKIVATSGAERSRLAPEAPTLKEAGVDFALEGWYALYAPKGVSAERVAELNAAMAQALAEDDVIERMASIGVDAKASSPAELAAMQQAETRMWGELVQQMGFAPLD